MTIPKAILATLIYIVVMELLGLWMLVGPKVDILSLAMVSRFINSTLLFIAIVLFIRKVIGGIGIVFRRTELKFYLLAIIAGVAFPFLQIGLNIIYYLGFYENMWNPGFHIERILGLNSFASVCIIPVAEELFFRRYIQDGLQQFYKPWLSLLVTSTLFAVIHINLFAPVFNLGYFDFHHVYLVFFGGLIAGVLYLKSKSIGPSIAMHMMWNLTVSIS